MVSTKLHVFKFGDDIWDPSHRFETSWLLPPWVLFAVRAAISFYAFFVLLFVIFWEIARYQNGTAMARFEFSYFTILCYWGIAFYFLTAAIHTFSYALHGGTPLLNRLPRPLQALHALFHTTITTFPLLVTIVYWGVIFRGVYPTGWFPQVFTAWSNISEHALNTCFALFEIFFARTNPAPWIHLLWLIAILACYLGLAYITVATKHQYVYSFLNPAVAKNGMVAAYVFGIAVAICIIFAVVRGLVVARKWVTEEKMGRQGKFYGGRGMGTGEIELETMRMWEK
ncbi:FAR-17a AIG1 protein [Rutstroemia sp. NJR-2017a WRK4]|nr:FAR-17a AIG1 protein [Rutstroemia sp. NJR-2017a WRK4]